MQLAHISLVCCSQRPHNLCSTCDKLFHNPCISHLAWRYPLAVTIATDMTPHQCDIHILTTPLQCSQYTEAIKVVSAKLCLKLSLRDVFAHKKYSSISSRLMTPSLWKNENKHNNKRLTNLSRSSTEKDSINGKFDEMLWNSSMLMYPDWSVSYALKTD